MTKAVAVKVIPKWQAILAAFATFCLVYTLGAIQPAGHAARSNAQPAPIVKQTVAVLAHNNQSFLPIVKSHNGSPDQDDDRDFVTTDFDLSANLIAQHLPSLFHLDSLKTNLHSSHFPRAPPQFSSQLT